MAVGLSTVNLANAWLNTIRGGGVGTTFTAITNIYVKLHIGDPTSAGAGSPSAVTTRVIVTLGAASGGALAMTGTAPSWSMTASETISHISVWDNISAGNFLFSAALTTPQAVVNTNTLNLNSLSFTLTPLAA